MRCSTRWSGADRLFKRLKVSRLDNCHDAQLRKLLRVDVLIVDDFARQCLSASEPED